MIPTYPPPSSTNYGSSPTEEQVFTFKRHESNTISFFIKTEDNKTEEVMKLTKDGMYYKGKFIKDAGEAHTAFLKTMQSMQNPLKTV